MKVIVGLGNPGETYQWSRHNIGFEVVDRLAEDHRIAINHKRLTAQYGRGTIHSERILLVKPLTFMNRSGFAVQKVTHYYKAGLEDLVVVHDDMDLPFGALRIKRWGADGGHQGVRSIMDSMAGNHFLRLKVGIGRPPAGMDPADYVLSAFDGFERRQLPEVIRRAAECVVVMIWKGVEAAMNRLSRRPIPPCQSP